MVVELKLLSSKRNVFGIKGFTKEIMKEYTIEELKDISLHEDIFLLVDKIIFPKDINPLRKMLENTKDFVFGYIFSDLSLIEIAKDLKIEKKLIYNPNTLLTNYMDFNYYANDNIMGGFISPFIPLEDVKKIIENKKMKTFYQGYGNLNMMYSRRPILENFLRHENIILDPKNKLDLTLLEETREEKYPIVEKEDSSLIYTAKPFSALEVLNELKDLDYLYLDETFTDLDIYDIFSRALNGSSVSIPNTDSGFLYKKIVYRVR